MGVWDIARPFMERLSDDIEESCSASILDGQDVVYVCGVQFHRVISVGVTLGARLPAHCTATGRVLLAEQPKENRQALVSALDLKPRTRYTVTRKRDFLKILAETQEQGWALVDQELEIGLLSIAIPLRTRSGKVVGAINVGCPTVRKKPDDMRRKILPRLQDTARQISEALPY